MRRKPIVSLLAVAGCAAAPPSAYERYLAGERDYIAAVSEHAELRREVASAKALLAALPPDRIARIDALDIPLLVAAGLEREHRNDWTRAGSDWTRYAMRHGCCRSPRESTLEQRRVATAQCDLTRYRQAAGRVPRTGRDRQTQFAAGVIPSGRDTFRGVLVTAAGERVPVVWGLGWSGTPGADPLDDRPRTFALRRLAGAHNWTAIWPGSADAAQDYRDRAGCLARLTAVAA